MCFHRPHQQTLITRPLLEYLVMRDNLILGFLYLYQLSKFIRLTGLALANDFGVWFKQTDDLFRKLSHPLEQARFGLADHTAHSLGARLHLL